MKTAASCEIEILPSNHPDSIKEISDKTTSYANQDIRVFSYKGILSSHDKAFGEILSRTMRTWTKMVMSIKSISQT
jgi:hypothetical protein